VAEKNCTTPPLSMGSRSTTSMRAQNRAPLNQSENDRYLTCG